ncbi:MAG: hypothetical protein IJ619_12085 [Eubacterium sp.]|nr:hypothetical protein [Eubacterium sp.]
MVDKRQINDWITNIEKLRKTLHTGGGAMISANYSKENNDLYASATACQNLLTLYFGYESVSADQLKRFKVLAEDMRQKVIAYKLAKENGKKPYSLTGDTNRGIAAAKGDKYKRLKAADDLSIYTLKDILPAVNGGIKELEGKQPPKISSEFTKIEQKLGASNLSADDIRKNLNQFAKDARPKLEIMTFHRSAVNARRSYQNACKNSYWGKNVSIGQLKKDFKEINNLHRMELMKYDDSAQFLNLYTKNRFKMRQVVDVYNWAMKCKNGNEKQRQQYNSFRVSMGLTNEKFEEYAEKVSTLEMIGRHMDARMAMCTNPEFLKMPAKEIQEIATMPKDKLASLLKTNEENAKNPQIPDEYKPSEAKLKYLRNASTLMKLSEMGVYEKPSGFRKEASYVDRTVGDKVKRRFKFLNVQGRLTRGKNKRDFGAGDFDIPVMAKAKLGKVSLKYKSENGLVNLGAHSGVLGGRVAGSVGVGFSLKNPLSTKIQALGVAEAYAVRGVAKAKLGTNDANLEGKAQGHIGHLKAEANVGIGHIYEVGDDGKVKTDGFGVQLKSGATAAVFNGKVQGALNLFGIRIVIEAEGKALGVGLEGEASFIPNKGLSLGFGGALGLGGGFKLSIEWKTLVDKYRAWKKRKGISKKTLEAKKEEERQRKERKKEAEKKKAAERKKQKEEMAKAQKANIRRTNSFDNKSNTQDNRIKRSGSQNNLANKNAEEKKVRNK